MKTFKADIIQEVFLDGVLKEDLLLRNRTVYVQKNGELLVNYLGGKRRVTRLPNGAIYWRFEMTTGRVMSLTQLIEGFNEKG